MCYAAMWNNGLSTEQLWPLRDGTTSAAKVTIVLWYKFSLAQYYSYSKPDAASANTPHDLELSQTVNYFFFDSGTSTSLFIIFDKPNDGSVRTF